eukprot:3472264-Rhodomonas_salina.1
MASRTRRMRVWSHIHSISSKHRAAAVRDGTATRKSTVQKTLSCGPLATPRRISSTVRAAHVTHSTSCSEL